MKCILYKTKATYFASIATKFNNPGAVGNYDPNTPYIDWLKKYFGAPYSDEKVVTINKNDAQLNMTNVYNYLVDAKTIKTGIQRFHDQVKRSANAKDLQYAKQDKQPETNNNNANNNNTAPKNNTTGDKSATSTDTVEANAPKTITNSAAIYSFVQGKYITEIDMPDQTINPDAQITEKNSDYTTAKKVYIGVMHDIIKAMMTGSEYIRSEYRAMVKWKINYYHPSNGQVRKRDKE